MGVFERVQSVSSSVTSLLISNWQSLTARLYSRALSISWLTLLEISLVIGWGLWVSRIYLNFDPLIWPLGGDFPLTIEPMFIWESLTECGACIFWNGTINGGYPSFIEAHAPVLQPLAVASTLIFGAINGSKVTLMLSFSVAGIGQWWLGRELGVGRLARMWMAAMAVAGVHLAGKMEMGLLGIVLSTAFATLSIPAVLRLHKKPSSAASAVLAISLALTWLAGQGYLQIALVASLFVALLAFGTGSELTQARFRNQLGLSLGLSVLLSAVFLVPFFRFFPSFGKLIDPNIEASQPLAYVPLNFVIQDFDLMRSDLLGQIGFPAMYLNFVGWLPILLAGWGAHKAFEGRRRTIYYFLGSIALLLLMASDEWVYVLKVIWEKGAISVRYPPLFLGLAVPFILGLAGIGIDHLWRYTWPQFEFRLSSNRAWRFKLIPFSLLIILPLSVKPVYEFGQDLMKVHEIEWTVFGLADQIEKDQSEWIKPPPDHYWRPFLISRNLKLTEIFRPWLWQQRFPPAPAQVITEVDALRSGEPGVRLDIYRDDEVHYAYVQTDNRNLPCRASSQGGRIDVHCEAQEAGRLVLMENFYPGWRVWRDGKLAEVIGQQWLGARKPAGAHTFQFRYMPLDVPLGILLSFVGLLICGWLLLRSEAEPQSGATSSED